MTRRDRISLTGLTVHGRHGVLAQEKRDGHDFVIDAALEIDTAPAARDDALGRTVNYAEVAHTVADVVADGSLDLIETLAQRIADAVLASQMLVRAVEVTVHKPTAPIDLPFADVAVAIRREAAPVEAVLALGSNLGDRAARLERAAGLLAATEGVEIAWRAPLVETDPVGGVAQEDFANTVLGLRTTLGPWELLDLAHRIEADAHRERTVRWGPRTLDVDVITWGALAQDDPDLTLPHPRAHERAFVLAPWSAVRPDDVLPGHGRVADLLAAAPDRDGVRPWGLR